MQAITHRLANFAWKNLKNVSFAPEWSSDKGTRASLLNRQTSDYLLS